MDHHGSGVLDWDGSVSVTGELVRIQQAHDNESAHITGTRCDEGTVSPPELP